MTVAAAMVLIPGFEGRTASAQVAAQTPFPGKNISQFVQPLPLLDLTATGLGLAVLDGTSPLDISMQEFDAKILPPGTFAPGVQPLTKVWGYIPGVSPVTIPRETYLGPVIVAQRGIPTQVTWINNLGTTTTSQLTFWKNATDQTLHWADPLNGEANAGAMAAIMMPGVPPTPPWDMNYAGPIPAAVHLHGGEIPPQLDGGPDAWYSSDGTFKGHGFYTHPAVPASANSAVYTYPNTQEAAMIWFHDHLLGATRLNVYAGLAGAYALIDPSLSLPAGLTPTGLQGPTGPELLIPMVIQDRMFDTTGQLYFPAGFPFTPNPDHPYWVPEFVGDTIVVNGKAWPYLSVEPRRYRFLFINGSNARTYELFFVNPVTKAMGPAIWQIGTDGGYLDAPVNIDPNAVAFNKLTLMPGERADVIVDFGGLPQGTRLILRNTGRTPYPKGASPNGSTLGQILQVRVDKPLSGTDVSYNPAGGTPIRGAANKLVRLVNPATGTLAVTAQKTRALSLNEVMGMPVTVGGLAYPGGPLEILVNNTKWNGVNPDMTVRGDFTAFTVNGITSYYSEVPDEGTTEVWEIINLTADAHPIHTHLTQFQLINRQNFNTNNYTAAYAAAFAGGGMDYMTNQPYLPGVYMPAYGPPLNYAPSAATGNKYGGNPNIAGFLQGKPMPPAANEAGWKDTIMALPGQVTRIAVRYAPTDVAAGVSGAYPFNPNGGHGYVWHCHIIDHEDNEMMRPLAVNPKPGAVRTKVRGVDY
jgi:FtsP/CotA-like multicopper oxidase with cupredoxin domain